MISSVGFTTQLWGLVTHSTCKIISNGFCFVFLRNDIFVSDQNVKAKSKRNKNCLYLFSWEFQGSHVGYFFYTSHICHAFPWTHTYVDELVKIFLKLPMKTVPWIRGPRETKERKVGEEDGPLAERDKPLWDRTNEILSPESGLKMWLVDWSENCQTLWRFDANIP